MANETYSEKVSVNINSSTLSSIDLLVDNGYGILLIDESCDEEKLFATVEKINVKGKVFCSDAVKKHYGIK